MIEVGTQSIFVAVASHDTLPNRTFPTADHARCSLHVSTKIIRKERFENSLFGDRGDRWGHLQKVCDKSFEYSFTHKYSVGGALATSQ